MMSKIFFIVVAFAFCEVARGNAAGELKDFLMSTQGMESTIKTAFPHTIESNIEALNTMEKTINIDSENVRLRLRQAAGTNDKVKNCIEKDKEDIIAYVNALSRANKQCKETGIKQLQTLRDNGKVNVLTPLHEFNTKLQKDTTKCIAEIEKKPQCANQILVSGKNKFAEIENKGKGLFDKVATVQIKSVDCFQNNAQRFAKEFERLSNKIRACAK